MHLRLLPSELGFCSNTVKKWPTIRLREERAYQDLADDSPPTLTSSFGNVLNAFRPDVALATLTFSLGSKPASGAGAGVEVSKDALRNQ